MATDKSGNQAIKTYDREHSFTSHGFSLPLVHIFMIFLYNIGLAFVNSDR